MRGNLITAEALRRDLVGARLPPAARCRRFPGWRHLAVRRRQRWHLAISLMRCIVPVMVLMVTPTASGALTPPTRDGCGVSPVAPFGLVGERLHFRMRRR